MGRAEILCKGQGMGQPVSSELPLEQAARIRSEGLNNCKPAAVKFTHSYLLTFLHLLDSFSPHSLDLSFYFLFTASVCTILQTMAVQ